MNPTRPFRSNAKSWDSDPGFFVQSFRTDDTEQGSAASASNKSVPPNRQILIFTLQNSLQLKKH
jgi:hypothetical protein